VSVVTEAVGVYRGYEVGSRSTVYIRVFLALYRTVITVIMLNSLHRCSFMWKCVYILYCTVHTLLNKYDFVLTVQCTCKQHLLSEKLAENVPIVCSD
jgi:hypothetical protein